MAQHLHGLSHSRHGATVNTRWASARSRAAGVTMARSDTTSFLPACIASLTSSSQTKSRGGWLGAFGEGACADGEALNPRDPRNASTRRARASAVTPTGPSVLGATWGRAAPADGRADDATAGDTSYARRLMFSRCRG